MDLTLLGQRKKEPRPKSKKHGEILYVIQNILYVRIAYLKSFRHYFKMDDIVRRIEALENKLKEEGWVYDSKWITQKEMQSRIYSKEICPECGSMDENCYCTDCYWCGERGLNS